ARPAAREPDVGHLIRARLAGGWADVAPAADAEHRPQADPLPAHTVRKATVGGSRDARTAGSRPANAPIRMAEAMPPAHASTGITTAQLFELAYTAVAVAPASTPTMPPMTASRIDSVRNWVRIWPFVAPR